MQKVYFLVTCSLSFLIVQFSQAQCSFVPTVSPTNIIMCPNETDTLTTQVYDSYQWYHDSILIPGATQQTHPVSYFQDAGTYFFVVATLNGCTDTSAEVLVDGWAFLPPAIISDGDFSIVPGLGTYVCQDDTMYLILTDPYDTNITWFLNGSPIAGATDDTLIPFQDGYYTVQGSPFICPNYVDNPGVDVSITFSNIPTPIITMQLNGDLLASPTQGFQVQWYLNGAIISGETDSLHTPLVIGSYTVELTDSLGCTNMSLPYVNQPSGIEEPEMHYTIYPNPASDYLIIEGLDKDVKMITISDMMGQIVGTISNPVNAIIDVEMLDAGQYIISIQNKSGLRKNIRFLKL